MKQLLIIVLACIGISAAAQNYPGAAASITGKIEGTLKDSISNQAVEYASVALYKNGNPAPVAGVVSEADGHFRLSGIAVGQYKIVVSFIGYTEKTIASVETTGAKPDLDLGTVKLSPESTALNEVVVQATPQLVQNKIDKVVYNVEKDVTAAGGNATDVLQKVPMVSVDMDGNVSVRGDANVRILINGKPTGATNANIADVLKTIPSDQIKNVEVVTSPSAKYDAEGSAGIINIITKSKSATGISGSVSGGVGTRQNNANANLNFNKDRFSLSANVGFNNGWPRTSTYSSTQTIDNGTANSLQTSNGQSEVERYGLNTSITAGYDFNAYNTLSTTLRYNDGGWNSDGKARSIFEDYLNAANNSEFTTATDSKNGWGSFDWNLDYIKKFKKDGHQLTFSTQWSRSKNTSNYVSRYSDFYTDQKADSDGTNNEYTLQLDYVLPVTEKFKLETGAKSIFRRFSSDFTNMVPDADGNFVYDPVNSNLYDYNQDVFAGYAVGTYELPKDYTLMLGARVEQTNIEGKPTNALQADLQSFTNDYTTFIPSFTLQKKLSDFSSLKLTYTKRIQRPNMNNLNPFVNRSNIQSQQEGNPNLEPEISQTVELGYSTFSPKRTINFSVYYRNISGLIEGIATPLEDESGTITRFQNVGENNSLGFNFFGSVNLFKGFSLRGNFNGYTYNPSASSAFASTQTSTGAYFQYSAFASGQYDFGKNLVAELFVIQNSRRRTLQGSNPAFNLVSLGVKKQFWDKKASLGINVTSPFKRDIEFRNESTGNGFSTTSNFAFPIQSFGLTFSYSFGKMTFNQPKTKGVNNDDMQQNQNSGGVPGQ